ncbi:XRE family transcriptional regulator [Cohnella sp. GCM10020058]|uniref:XRE family transcriptional regulator n=1 Tax=Cohnella sp. GCM10020058 TaxID=3317330 RepID=UPI0036399F54
MSIVNGDNLGKIRMFYRLSCDEIGALMDVSGRFVSYVERGERILPEYRAMRLEDELGLTPEKLTRILAIQKSGKFARFAEVYATG